MGETPIKPVPNSRMNWHGANMVSCRILTTPVRGEIYRIILLPLNMRGDVRSDVLAMDVWLNAEDRSMSPKDRTFCDTGTGIYESIDLLDAYLDRWGVRWAKDNTRKKLIFLVEDYKQMRQVSNWLAEYEDDYVRLIVPLTVIANFVNDHECEHARLIPFDKETNGLACVTKLRIESYAGDPVLRARGVAAAYKRLLRFND